MTGLVNEGHGHVSKRPDGVRARCGGPRFCSECAKDLARKVAEDDRERGPPAGPPALRPLMTVRCSDLMAAARDEITSLRLRISELEGKWQPIETAPKGEGREWERPTVSLWAAGRARHGRWCPDEYAARPKPFWSIETQLGVAWMRANQPTHWQPLPPPPQSGDK